MLGITLADDQLKSVVDAFIEAAIWADKLEGSSPRASKEAKEKASRFIQAFWTAHADKCADITTRYKPNKVLSPAYRNYQLYQQLESFGHDLYLTCAGHGVGFWDRQALEGPGREISDLIRSEGWVVEANFHRGWLYLNTTTE